MTTELQEAVNAATAATSGSLIQKYISPRILDYQRRFSPLLLATPTEKITTNVYNFTQRNRRPQGGAVADGGARTPSNSVFAQTPVTIKNYQTVGQVTGFAQAVTAGVIGNYIRSEMDSAMKSQLWSVETSMIYGNAAATLGLGGIATGQGPDMDGLEQFCNVYTGGSQNVIDAAGANLAFSGATGLDSLIDLVEENVSAAIGGDYMFVGSPKAINKAGGLLLNQQRFVDTTEIAAGLTVQTYRNIPMIKSSFLANRGQQMGTVTPSAGGTGGTLATATYFYVIVPVINRFGELAPSTEVSQAITSGQNATLTFAAPSDSEGNEVMLYKVFRSTSTGTEVLVGEVAATDQTGAAVTSIVDTGANLLANGLAPTGSTPTAYVGGNSSAKPKASGQEDLYLIPRDPDALVRPYVRDFFVEQLAKTVSAPDVMPFYVQNDTCLAVRAPKYVARLARLAVVL